MITLLVLSTLARQWRRLACRLSEARRTRRDMQELARMSAYELSDLGISHATLAIGRRDSRCG